MSGNVCIAWEGSMWHDCAEERRPSDPDVSTTSLSVLRFLTSLTSASSLFSAESAAERWIVFLAAFSGGHKENRITFMSTGLSERHTLTHIPFQMCRRHLIFPSTIQSYSAAASSCSLYGLQCDIALWCFSLTLPNNRWGGLNLEIALFCI